MADRKKSSGSAPGARKQTSQRVSSLASKVLSGKVKPSAAQIMTLAGSVMSQDEKGKRKP
jgi:hypothetical protein